jgi:prepilin-type N-terminal cleavage/methylation domain-containing protein
MKRVNQRRIQRSRSGFTLIELMIVVSIIGLISTIAIPGYQKMTMKAKRSEREYTFTSISRAIQQYHTVNERFWYNFGGGTSYAYGPMNPPPSPSYNGQKKQFIKNYVTPIGWNNVDWQPEGYVYFHYQVAGYAYPGTSTSYYYITAYTDLDGDGVINQKQHLWVLESSGKWSDSAWYWNNYDNDTTTY